MALHAPGAHPTPTNPAQVRALYPARLGPAAGGLHRYPPPPTHTHTHTSPPPPKLTPTAAAAATTTRTRRRHWLRALPPWFWRHRSARPAAAHRRNVGQLRAMWAGRAVRAGQGGRAGLLVGTLAPTHPPTHPLTHTPYIPPLSCARPVGLVRARVGQRLCTGRRVQSLGPPRGGVPEAPRRAAASGRRAGQLCDTRCGLRPAGQWTVEASWHWPLQ